jgi:hypothetical protein
MIRSGGTKITPVAMAVLKNRVGVNGIRHTPAHVIALTWPVPDNHGT